MKVLNNYSIIYIQFEIQEDSGDIVFYRRALDSDNWERLYGESWESHYQDIELEKIFE